MNMSYIGRRPCGCVVAAFVDRPEFKKDIARELSRWIKSGYTVEHVTSEYVRNNMKSCKCKPEDKTLP